MQTSQTITALIIAAASAGVFHTLIGPDHYLPFAAIGKLRGWSLAKTLRATFACGLGHVLSSIFIGCVGIALGSSLGLLEQIEGSRGDIVKWMLLAFALAYFVYGIKRGYAAKKAGDKNISEDEECFLSGKCSCIHSHPHTPSGKNLDKTSFWILFVIFIFGPCEILIPLVMYPASQFDWIGVFSVAAVFSLSTIFTMLACVSAIFCGIKNLKFDCLSNWGHAITGTVLLLCAAFMLSGF